MDEEAISRAQSSFGSSLVAQGNGPCTKLDHVTICDFSLHTFVNHTTFIIAMDPRSYWWTSLFYTEPYPGQWILGSTFFRVENIICHATLESTPNHSLFKPRKDWPKYTYVWICSVSLYRSAADLNSIGMSLIFVTLMQDWLIKFYLRLGVI